MPVTVILPRALLPYARGATQLRVDEPCASAADVLAALGRAWPAVLDRVVTEQGAVREHVNVFVGAENVRFAGGLATPVGDGDTVTIVAAVSGG